MTISSLFLIIKIMNYLKQYIKLVKKASKRQKLKDVYYEKHHIFPKSIFGKNSLLVELTFKEHVFAHHLLYKICLRRYGEEHVRTIKMAHALRSFLALNKNRQKHISAKDVSKYLKNKTNKVIHKHTEETKRILSEKSSGENNANYGRVKEKHPLWGTKNSEETRRKKSEARKNYLAGLEVHPSKGREPWNKGKRTPQEAIEKRKKTLNGRKTYEGIKRNFYNKYTGLTELDITPSELIRKYNLKSAGNLSQVISNKRDNYKGWKLLEILETDSETTEENSARTPDT